MKNNMKLPVIVTIPKKSIPIVEINVGEKASSVKRTRRDVLPTAESPMSNNLKR